MQIGFLVIIGFVVATYLVGKRVVCQVGFLRKFVHGSETVAVFV